MLMHYNSDVPNFRFPETQEPASVIPAPGSAGEIYSTNAEVFVSVRSRSRRRFEEVGNYSASIGVEMLNPEVWDDFKLFSEINDFDWSGTHTMPDGFDLEDQTDEVMEAGIALMMSFLGLQSQADKLMNAIKEIMVFIEPFKSLMDPQNAIKIALSASGIDADGIFERLNSIQNIATSGVSSLVDAICNTIPDWLGLSDLDVEFPFSLPSLYSMINFMECQFPDDAISGVVISALKGLLEGSTRGYIATGISIIGIMLGVGGIIFSGISFFLSSAGSFSAVAAKYLGMIIGIIGMMVTLSGVLGYVDSTVCAIFGVIINWWGTWMFGVGTAISGNSNHIEVLIHGGGVVCTWAGLIASSQDW